MGNDESFDWRDDSERFKKNYSRWSVSKYRPSWASSDRKLNFSTPFLVLAIIVLFTATSINCERVNDLEERICLREKQLVNSGIYTGPICEWYR